MSLTQLVLSYPDFVSGTVIDPEHFDQNNFEIKTKVNQIVDAVNNVYNKTEVTNMLSDMVLNGVVDNSISEAKMAADMKKQAGGVLPFNSYTAADVFAKVLTLDGAGSGLDADLFNGLSAASYQLAITKGTSSLPTTGWTNLGTGDYPLVYSITIAGVTTNHAVDIFIDKDAFDLAGEAEICPTTETYAGGVKVYAKNAPTSAISIEYRVVKV